LVNNPVGNTYHFFEKWYVYPSILCHLNNVNYGLG